MNSQGWRPPLAAFLLCYLIRIDSELGGKYCLRPKRLLFHLILHRHRCFQVPQIPNPRAGESPHSGHVLSIYTWPFLLPRCHRTAFLMGDTSWHSYHMLRI